MRNWSATAAQTPATRAVAITASATPFDQTRGVFIATAGDFTIKFADAATSVTMTLPVGVHPFSIDVCSSGTGLWALY